MGNNGETVWLQCSYEFTTRVLKVNFLQFFDFAFFAVFFWNFLYYDSLLLRKMRSKSRPLFA